jgi:hypothetical protein
MSAISVIPGLLAALADWLSFAKCRGSSTRRLSWRHRCAAVRNTVGTLITCAVAAAAGSLSRRCELTTKDITRWTALDRAHVRLKA